MTIWASGFVMVADRYMKGDRIVAYRYSVFDCGEVAWRNWKHELHLCLCHQGYCE